MSVYQSLTDIADTIRGYTGGKEKLSLSEMISGIDDVYLIGLRFGENSSNNTNKPFEVHKITVASDSPSAQTATYWLRNSEFVKQHCNDAGFTIQLISLQAFTDGYAVGYGYNGNRQVMDNGGSLITGFQIYRTSSNSISIKAEGGGGVNLANKYTGIPYAKEDGSILSIHGSGSTQLRAGDYLLILSVAEV